MRLVKGTTCVAQVLSRVSLLGFFPLGAAIIAVWVVPAPHGAFLAMTMLCMGRIARPALG